MQNRIDQLVSGKSTPKPNPQTVKSVSDAATMASNQMAGLTKKVEEGIARHPVISLGVGLVIGATLGWLLKRK
jgi:hypothetical protein